MKKKVICKLLSLVMVTSLLAGCGSGTEGRKQAASANNNTQQEESENAETEGAKKYPEFITVDVFDSQANYQGIQAGWFGQMVKDKFNMELNIIAPNVAGGGETLYQTRSAAGNLGDLIIMQLKGGKLQDLVTASLLTDMTSYLDGQDNLNGYINAIKTVNGNLVEEEGTWAIPSEVTKQSATDMINTTELNSGIYIRWDLYKELGYPKMTTFEDFLTVMKDMQDMAGKSDSGKDVYAFSLFKDWDGALINAGTWLPSDYGWSTDSFVLQKADDAEEPIDFLAEGSPYLRGLEFFFEANQMGLLDPESTTQNFDTLRTKYEDGAVLFSPWPWLGQASYNTTEHTSAGKGFQTASIDDLQIREWGCYENGNTEVGIMIGSQAQDPQRMADFINWLYSPEGIQSSQFELVDEMYEITDNGPVLTDLGVAAKIDGDVDMPASYGGGTYKDGRPGLSYKCVSLSEVNPETGYTYTHATWDSYIELTSTEVDKDWQKHMDAKNAADYWKKTDRMCVSVGTDFATPADSTDIATMRSQIGEITKEYSWKAIYADNKDSFDSTISEMRQIVEGLGYDDVVAVDLENCAALKEARQKVLSR